MATILAHFCGISAATKKRSSNFLLSKWQRNNVPHGFEQCIRWLVGQHTTKRQIQDDKHRLYLAEFFIYIYSGKKIRTITLLWQYMYIIEIVLIDNSLHSSLKPDIVDRLVFLRRIGLCFLRVLFLCMLTKHIASLFWDWCLFSYWCCTYNLSKL